MDSLLFGYQYLNFYPAIEKAKLLIIRQYTFYRVFNVSIARFGNKYLYSARIRLQRKEDPSDELIPGNLTKCGVDPGTNFWWGRWGFGTGNDITVFFLGDHTKEEFELLRLSHTIPHNFYTSKLIGEYLIHDGDLRLAHLDGEIYIQSANLRYFLRVVKIEDGVLFLENSWSNYQTIKLSNNR